MENPFLLIEQRLTTIENHLQNLLKEKPSPSSIPVNKEESNQKFSISELASYLQVAKSTIHRYKNNRIFPFYQAGRTVFFKKHEVDSAMQALKNDYYRKRRGY